MRLLFSEFPARYDDYYFPYQVYALKEEDDDYGSLYSNGFLPTRLDQRLYYMARSLRLNTQLFELSSENRRVKRKAKDVKAKLVSLEEFEYDYKIGKWGSDFYTERFGKGTMSAQKVKWLFTSGAMTDLMVYKIKKEVVGYCPVIKDETMMHYAYPFYKTKHLKINLGMAMMLMAIEKAVEQGLNYVYLGTCYTETSLYKTQFSGLEYFTGMGWSSDIMQLKSQVREPFDGHLLEMVEDKSEFITALLQ